MTTRFIGEEVEVMLVSGSFTKRPACPRAFIWRDETHVVDRCLEEWRDYARRGRMAHNMRQSHLEAAAGRGSRGVGRHYFRVMTDDSRVFDLYYDRAPRDTIDRAGSWHLLRELGSKREQA